jgi:hypothetical protein
VVEELDRVFDGDDVLVRSRLILSIIAASVVDLPEPVGPVTSTRPRGLLQISSTTAAAELLESEDLVGDLPVDGGGGAALVEDVRAEAGRALDAEREVELEVLLEAMLLRVGEHRSTRAAWFPGASGGMSSGTSLPSMRI